MGDGVKSTGFELIKQGGYKPEGGKDIKSKEDIIKTSDGTIWGVKYTDTDGNKGNYERASLRTYSEKDGKLVPNADEQNIAGMSDLTKEYQVFGEQRNIIREEPEVFLKDNEGYSSEIKNNKGLVAYLSGQMASDENNSGIKPAKEGFVSGENNSQYLVPKNDGQGSLTRMEKPLLFQPEPENKNKVETMPEDISSRAPDKINFFER